ncbi:unnamed protein product [Boreogadus saida]
MAAAASAERPAEAKEMCPGSGPLLRLRSASDPQARAPTGELKCPAGCGGDLPGPGPAALPRCGLSACLRCFQRTRSGPRCRLRGSCRRPGSETGPAVEPEPWEPSRRSRPERCRSRLDRRKEVDPRVQTPEVDPLDPSGPDSRDSSTLILMLLQQGLAVVQGLYDGCGSSMMLWSQYDGCGSSMMAVVPYDGCGSSMMLWSQYDGSGSSMMLWFQWSQYDGCGSSGSSMTAVVPWFQYDGCGSSMMLWFQYDGCGSSMMAVVPWFQYDGCGSSGSSMMLWFQYGGCGSSMMAVVPYDGSGSSGSSMMLWFQYGGCGSSMMLWFQYDGCGSSMVDVVPYDGSGSSMMLWFQWSQYDGCGSSGSSMMLWFQYDGCGSSMMAVVPYDGCGSSGSSMMLRFQYDGCGSSMMLWFQYDGCGSSMMAVVPYDGCGSSMMLWFQWFQYDGCGSNSSEAGSQGSRCGGMTSDQQSKVKVKAVLSDSENEEPVGKRTRNVSGALRKSKTPSAFRDASQRSQSCTASVEGGGKRRFLPQSSAMNAAGARHSFAAGILLSSENSPAVSSPVSGDRRLAWRGPTASFPPPPAPARPERSVSPESNDSISEELNHFKPIVCSPCTPPRRLADGRLLETAVVKSTPRNLLRGLQSPTSYQASPAVLLKWRQIELDRQSLRVTSKATLTGSPPAAPEEGPPAQGGFPAPPPLRARRRVFGPAGEPADLKRTAAKDPSPGPWRSRTPGPPLAKETETRDHPDPRRGKHSQKTRHTEPPPPPPDGKRARVLLQPAPPPAPGGPFPRVPPDLPGRSALGCEQQPGGKARAPRYLLRPRAAKQSQRRQSPRRPKRLSRKH